MNVAKPAGGQWTVEDIPRKLALRAGLPGAFVFDQAALALRHAKAREVSVEDRFALALPASWLVNNPANSRVLRRWAEEPQREVWLALVEALDMEGGARAFLDSRTPARADEIALALRALGSEPFVIEAVSKVLALLLPDLVPLMPMPARTFVLGEANASDPSSFIAMIDWFAEAAVANEAELGHEVLTAAQVLDRVLWFDSEGHRHFAAKAE